MTYWYLPAQPPSASVAPPSATSAHGEDASSHITPSGFCCNAHACEPQKPSGVSLPGIGTRLLASSSRRRRGGCCAPPSSRRRRVFLFLRLHRVADVLDEEGEILRVRIFVVCTGGQLLEHVGPAEAFGHQLFGGEPPGWQRRGASFVGGRPARAVFTAERCQAAGISNRGEPLGTPPTRSVINHARARTRPAGRVQDR